VQRRVAVRVDLKEIAGFAQKFRIGFHGHEAQQQSFDFIKREKVGMKHCRIFFISLAGKQHGFEVSECFTLIEAVKNSYCFRADHIVKVGKQRNQKRFDLLRSEFFKNFDSSGKNLRIAVMAELFNLIDKFSSSMFADKL